MNKLKPNQFKIADNIITERPILYQTEMVKAILEGRKTQTRRTKGLEKYLNDSLILVGKVNELKMKCVCKMHKDGGVTLTRPSYGQPGDLLWVRETWAKPQNLFPPKSVKYIFKANYDKSIGVKWKPSIHMPKSAARIWLMIEDITVERLKDISEENAIAEGIESKFSGIFQEMRYRDYFDGKRREKVFNLYPNLKKQTGFGSMPWPDWRDPVTSFCSLWMSINGKDSWSKNPWVWVIKFRVLSKTGRPRDKTIFHNILNVVHGETSYMTF